MLSSPFSLRTDYTDADPVSSLDLNRRGRILGAQLPGALRAAGLVPGIYPLWNPEATLPFSQYAVALAQAAQSALLIQVQNGRWRCSAGAALIECGDTSGSGALVYTQTDGLSVAIQTPDAGAALYIHLSLQVPDDVATPGALDSLLGDAPVLLVSDLDNEPHSLLLASVDDKGTLTDRRAFALPILLANEIVALSARLDALSQTSTDGNGNPTPVTPLQFAQLQQQVKDLSDRFNTYVQNAQGNTVTAVNMTPQTLLVNVNKLIAHVCNLNPSAVRDFSAGVDMPDITGNGQMLNGEAQPNITIGGNAIYDEKRGVVTGTPEVGE